VSGVTPTDNLMAVSRGSSECEGVLRGPFCAEVWASVAVSTLFSPNDRPSGEALGMYLDGRSGDYRVGFRSARITSGFRSRTPDLRS